MLSIINCKHAVYYQKVNILIAASLHTLKIALLVYDFSGDVHSKVSNKLTRGSRGSIPVPYDTAILKLSLELTISDMQACLF